METAKVDIRKLQLLNDRINQTIDALHQLRLSVHGVQSSPFGVGAQAGVYGQSGLGHTSTIPGINPLLSQQPWAQQPGLGHTSYNPLMTAAVNPLMAQQLSVPGMMGGLSHSPFNPYVNPLLAQQAIPGMYGAQNYLPSFPGGLSHTSAFNPLYSTMLPQQSWNPMASINPLFSQFSTGLSHTTPDVSVLTDPIWATRVQQTFPYAFSPTSPINGSMA